MWEAFEAGDLRRETIQQRLDDFQSREDARAAISRIEGELSATGARAATVDTAQGLVTLIREVWDRAAVADRKALARSLSDALGGLVVTEAGVLAADGIVVAEPSGAAQRSKTAWPRRDFVVNATTTGNSTVSLAATSRSAMLAWTGVRTTGAPVARRAEESPGHVETRPNQRQENLQSIACNPF